MPELLNPNATFPYVLPADRDLPNPVTFHLRVLSRSADAKLHHLNTSCIEAGTDIDRRQAIQNEMLDLIIESITNIPPGWTAAQIREALTIHETWDLISTVREGGALSPDQRKKFAPQSFCDTATSADPVAPASPASPPSPTPPQPSSHAPSVTSEGATSATSSGGSP